jgi:hypothetical protein
LRLSNVYNSNAEENRLGFNYTTSIKCLLEHNIVMKYNAIHQSDFIYPEMATTLLVYNGSEICS